MNKILPKVSVVTITYGHEKYIEDTLNGVIMQRYDGPIEFIIANDHSPDETDAVVKQYLATHVIPQNIEIRYTNHSENKGMMPNFIWALQEASGTYIAFCEGDDYWTDPFKLQKQVRFLENNPEYSMCFTNRSILDETNHIENADVIEKDYSTEDVLKGFIAFTLTIILRNNSDVIQNLCKCNFNVGDRPLTYFCSLAGKIKLLKDNTAVYRYNGLGVWSSKRTDDIAYQNLKNLKEFHTLIGINNYKYFLNQVTGIVLVSLLRTKSLRNLFKLNEEFKKLGIPLFPVYLNIFNYCFTVIRRKI